MLGADVFTGRITKKFKAPKGFKGQLTLPNGNNIFLFSQWEGKTTEHLTASVGKDEILSGNLRFPGKDAKSQIPILEVVGVGLDDGSIVKYGRLTRDAELKYTQKGKQYTQFSIAVNYGWGDKKETDFVNCTLWGNAEKESNPAVYLAQNGSKGREIVIKGRLQMFTTKEGGTACSVVVSDWFFVGTAPAKDTKVANQPADWSDIGQVVEIDDEDIPF